MYAGISAVGGAGVWTVGVPWVRPGVQQHDPLIGVSDHRSAVQAHRRLDPGLVLHPGAGEAGLHWRSRRHRWRHRLRACRSALHGLGLSAHPAPHPFAGAFGAAGQRQADPENLSAAGYPHHHHRRLHLHHDCCGQRPGAGSAAKRRTAAQRGCRQKPDGQLHWGADSLSDPCRPDGSHHRLRHPRRDHLLHPEGSDGRGQDRWLLTENCRSAGLPLRHRDAGAGQAHRAAALPQPGRRHRRHHSVHPGHRQHLRLPHAGGNFRTASL